MDVVDAWVLDFAAALLDAAAVALVLENVAALALLAVLAVALVLVVVVAAAGAAAVILGVLWVAKMLVEQPVQLTETLQSQHQV